MAFPILGALAGLFAADKISPKDITTQANMHFINDTPRPVQVEIVDSVAMSENFPNTTVGPRQRVTHSVGASALPAQSSFVISVGGNKVVEVKIGSGVYSTSARYLDNRPGGNFITKFLAPSKPFQAGTDYDFYFFWGPSTLPQMINGLLDANLPALRAALPNMGLEIPISKYKLKISSFEGSPICSYATVIPDRQRGNSFHVTAVFELQSGRVSGNLSLDSKDPSFSLRLTDFAVLVGVHIDLAEKRVQVEKLYFSLGDKDFQGDIGSFLSALSFVFPQISILLQQVITPYRIAGLLNTTYNSNVLNPINDKLNSYRGSIKSKTDTNKLMVDELKQIFADHYQYDEFLIHDGSQKPTAARPPRPDTVTWMSHPVVQKKTIDQLHIVGTHDTGAYVFNGGLSEVKYPGIGILWGLRDGPAPVDGKNPFPADFSDNTILYLGPRLRGFILGTIVKSFAQAQGSPVSLQLAFGIRHFDFRVYWDTHDKDFFIQHALKGPHFSHFLRDIQTFLSEHGASRELIFANISHTGLKDQPDLQKKLTALVREYIPDKNIYYEKHDGNKCYPFSNLAKKRLEEITRDHPKVMFINGDYGEFFYGETITNTEGFAGRPWSDGDGTHSDIGALIAAEYKFVTECQQPLRSIGWAIPADASLVLDLIEVTLLNMAELPVMLLKDFARKMNGALQKFLTSKKMDWNLVNIDWCELRDDWDPVAEVVKWTRGEDSVLKGTSLTPQREGPPPS